MRYQFVREHQELFSVVCLCRILGLSRSGYYAWLNRPESRRTRENRRLLAEIRVIHQECDRVYGSPRVTVELRERGLPCSENRVARLMRQAGIRSKTVKPFRVTTDSRHHLPIAPNVLDRRFTVDRPNEVWVSDITYIWTIEGWLYLAVVLDLYSRLVVGWAAGSRIDTQLTLTALHRALQRRQVVNGPMHHSDQGKQYAAERYQPAAAGWRIIGSPAA